MALVPLVLFFLVPFFLICFFFVLSGLGNPGPRGLGVPGPDSPCLGPRGCGHHALLVFYLLVFILLLVIIYA